MKTIEERALINFAYEYYFCGRDLSKDMVCRAYMKGAKDQKEIDDAVIKKLNSIIKQFSSVLGIGTKWFSEDTNLKANTELNEMLLNYRKQIDDAELNKLRFLLENEA